MFIVHVARLTWNLVNLEVNPTQFPTWISFSTLFPCRKSDTLTFKHLLDGRYLVPSGWRYGGRSCYCILVATAAFRTLSAEIWGQCDPPHVWGEWRLSNVTSLLDVPQQRESEEGFKACLVWTSQSRSCIFVLISFFASHTCFSGINSHKHWTLFCQKRYDLSSVPHCETKWTKCLKNKRESWE